MPIGYTPRPTGLIDATYRVIAKLGSRLATNTRPVLTPEALAGFRAAQRLAYDCVESVGKRVRLNMTEIEVSAMLAEYLAGHGCNRYLHRPFAWFGEHSRFDGYRGYDDYHPSDRRLREGEVAILDVSPMVRGFTADVGHSISIGHNPELEAAKAFLLEVRHVIPGLFNQSRNPAQVWAAVDEMIRKAGYDNIHSKYPFAVLGHHVFIVDGEPRPVSRRGGSWIGWFSTEANLRFVRSGFNAVLTPENVGSKQGLWAIEPHIGWHGNGAKFEELLIVDQHGARWLDDDVPHMRAPRQAQGEAPADTAKPNT